MACEFRRTNFFDATLDGCKLAGSVFADCTLRPIKVVGGQWQGVTIRGGNLSKLDLTGLDLREADLSLSDLSGAVLRDARLDGATLRDTDLGGADLRGASLSGVDLTAARLAAYAARPARRRTARGAARRGRRPVVRSRPVETLCRVIPWQHLMATVDRVTAPHVVVLFGATGDLARRKLLPGLLRLTQSGLLSHARIVGTSLEDLTTEEFIERAHTACSEFGKGGFDDEARARFASLLTYVPQSRGPHELAEAVHKAEADLGGTVRYAASTT